MGILTQGKIQMMYRNKMLITLCIASSLSVSAANALEVDLNDSLSPAVSPNYSDIKTILVNSDTDPVVVTPSAKAFKLRASKSLSTRSLSTESVATNAVTATYTPLCTTLSTNLVYTLNGTQTGGTYCYHFNISQRAKTTTVLLSQGVGTDFTLNLLQDINGTLYTIATSNNADNINEIIKTMTNPGEYYWYMEANSATNATIQFGAVESINFDTYEVNDASNVSTLLTGERNFVMGNHEDGNDIDYFHYQLPLDDSIDIKLNDMESPGQWILELNLNGIWQTLTTGNISSNYHTYTNQLAGTVVQVRVKPNPSLVQDPTKNYRLTVGASQKAAQVRLMHRFSGSVSLQQRVNQQATLSPPSGYDDLINMVDISSLNGSSSGINCDLDLLDKSNRRFEANKCGYSYQDNLNSKSVSPVTLKYSIYHADFADQSTRQFNDNITLNFGLSQDLDKDGLPYWFEEKYGTNDEHPNDVNSDNDSDGHSNLAEYNANTDPADPNSHP